MLNKNNVNVQLTSQSVSKVCVAFHQLFYFVTVAKYDGY